jgi:PASTA domain
VDGRHDEDDAPTEWFPPVPPPVTGWQPAADETVQLPRLPDEPPAEGTRSWPEWPQAAGAGSAAAYENEPAYERPGQDGGPAAYDSGSAAADAAADEGGASGPVPGLAGVGPAEVESPSPGAHRDGGGAARPWALLGGILVAALLAVGGVVWLIESSIGGDPAPVTAPPVTRSATPSPTPSPTPSEDDAPYTPPATTAAPTTRVTLPPVPSASRFPTPRRTTPRPTQDAGFVTVPDVVGMRVNAARRVLEQAGLNASVLFGGGNDNSRQVVAQQPRGGRVARGSTVLLLTGRTRDR